MDDLAKLLIGLGVAIALTGGVLLLVTRVGGITRLPGDFVFQSGGLSCVVPIVTSIILSIVLTIVLNLILRIIK